MRAPTDVLNEYLAIQTDLRALTREWLATSEALRRIEIEAVMSALRSASTALMGEYSAACRARARELEYWRVLAPKSL